MSGRVYRDFSELTFMEIRALDRDVGAPTVYLISGTHSQPFNGRLIAAFSPAVRQTLSNDQSSIIQILVPEVGPDTIHFVAEWIVTRRRKTTLIYDDINEEIPRDYHIDLLKGPALFLEVWWLFAVRLECGQAAAPMMKKFREGCKAYVTGILDGVPNEYDILKVIESQIFWPGCLGRGTGGPLDVFWEAAAEAFEEKIVPMQVHLNRFCTMFLPEDILQRAIKYFAIRVYRGNEQLLTQLYNLRDEKIGELRMHWEHHLSGLGH